ncbi:hypothetical protein JHK87_024277 [Glycine soja]|nr:hypothetical protein JHK87_024277 [Glycine soja]
MVSVEEIRKAQRAEGPATVMAIGTATPPNCVDQSDKSMIKKRYMYLNEEILKENPSVCAYMAPSLDARQDMVVVEVPKLGKEAATKAIKEWAHKTARTLSLRQALHEITAVTFRGPSDTHLDSLVGQALFGDGAAAIIVGSDPLPAEKPLFELVWTAQTILPDSEGAIDGHLREVGLTFHLLKDVPGLISKNIQKALVEAFQPLGIDDYNSIFWIAHPGGPAILDQVEAKLGLKPEKMEATRHVLSEYGNMSSACVLFILDQMRKKSIENGLGTTGEGLEWGVLFGFGPGLTVETVVLRSVTV